MPRSASLTLGIELNDHEIRVALVSLAGETPSVQALCESPLPADAIVAGVIQDQTTVAETLSQLVKSLSVGPSIPAVVGIPSSLVTTRLLSIPPCEDREVPALVEGEMEHLGILTEDGPLEVIAYPRRADAPAGEPRSATVIMADHSVIRKVKDTVEVAGIKVAAVETSQVGKLRAATLAMPITAATLFLVMGPHLTGLSYFAGPNPVANRRVEVGASTLFRGADSFASDNVATALRVDHAAIDRLAIESLQLMEFVQRDHAEEIESVRVYALEPEVEVLAPMLERRFGIPTTFSPPPPGLDDVRYSVAYGLAVREFEGSYRMPKVDLSAKLRRQSDAREAKQNLVGSMVASGFALFAGLVAFVCYGRLIASLEDHARRASADLSKVRSQTDSLRSARAEEDLLYRTLREEGVPLGTMMDDVVRGVDAEVRLKSVGVGKDLCLKIQGEARDEAALGRMTQRLQSSPILTNVSLVQFDRASTPDGVPLTFEIDATTVSAARIQMGGRS